MDGGCVWPYVLSGSSNLAWSVTGWGDTTAVPEVRTCPPTIGTIGTSITRTVLYRTNLGHTRATAEFATKVNSA